LAESLAQVKWRQDENLLVGIEDYGDAGVYKLENNLAIIGTVDFFTPIVDDPYLFGKIAVTNALSDVYAVGGEPILAMNIVCFPIEKLENKILKKILEGGSKKLEEANVILIGGHTVEDEEIKYGLAVIGKVHPKELIKNRGCKVGDKLVLTKPIGTGVIATAIKRKIEVKHYHKVIQSMETLNKEVSIIMKNFSAHACTDITGFGLIGHICEMVIENDGLGVKLYSKNIPVFEGVKELVENKIIPKGLEKNKQFRRKYISFNPKKVPSWLIDLLFDPQTSGGLLIAFPKNKVELAIEQMRRKKIEAQIIGEIVKDKNITLCSYF
jgi:selenide,water dikinase